MESGCGGQVVVSAHVVAGEELGGGSVWRTMGVSVREGRWVTYVSTGPFFGSTVYAGITGGRC